jgi:ubiquitin C-terminal hydrolase
MNSFKFFLPSIFSNHLALRRPSSSVLSPIQLLQSTALRKRLKYIHEQQDAQELFHHVMDIIDSEQKGL